MGNSNGWGVVTSGEQQARNNNGPKAMNGQQPQAKSNTTNKSNTISKNNPKAENKHNLEITNYKPYKTNQKTKYN